MTEPVRNIQCSDGLSRTFHPVSGTSEFVRVGKKPVTGYIFEGDFYAYDGARNSELLSEDLRKE